MNAVDPTSRIDRNATLGENVSIGPYCVIGPDVTIGDGCRLVAHVHLMGHTTIGPRTIIYPFASLGAPPQSRHYRGGKTRLEIGADCDIREGAIINTGTEADRGLTSVGDRCFLMGNIHIGHDCQVGNDVVMANHAALSGHCVVQDFVFLGGQSGVLQYTRIGAHAMISGMCGVRADIIPYGFALGSIGRLGGINVVGMKRRGMSRESMRAVRTAYKAIFSDTEPFAERVERLAAEPNLDPAVTRMIEFIREGGKRALLQPGSNHEE